MKLRMTIDDALAAACEWTRGMTLHADSSGARVWCVLMIEEIEHLRARVAMLEADENDSRAVTAMPIMIGEDQCYLPCNAHGIVKRALRDAERLDWLSRTDQAIGCVALPRECMAPHTHSLRAAIDCAMLMEHT